MSNENTALKNVDAAARRGFFFGAKAAILPGVIAGPISLGQLFDSVIFPRGLDPVSFLAAIVSAGGVLLAGLGGMTLVGACLGALVMSVVAIFSELWK